MGPIINSTEPDLRNFRALGGKLIMYHGWADQAINPGNSVDYLNSVARFFEKLDGGEGGNQQANSNVDAFPTMNAETEGGPSQTLRWPPTMGTP